jgi:uroporphyrinogen decarboxylase
MTWVLKFSDGHRERMETCLAGKKMAAPPVALWRHFPVDDQAPDRLARAISNYQDTFDFDLIKVTPASSFCLRDWGIQDTWNGNPEGTRDYTYPVIHKPGDWSKLGLLDPREGYLGDQLEVLRLLAKDYRPGTPILQTIFDPMSQAKNLAGGTALITMLREAPEALHAGLRIITYRTIRFLLECKKIGIDGIFLAVQHAQSSLLTEPEFETFCKPYDLEILQAASDLWLNMVHIHGEGIYFDHVATYPAQVLNWHDRHTSPSLQKARDIFNGTICGGLRRIESLVLGTPDLIQAEALEAFELSGGNKFVLGTGCVVPITAPFGNILAARNALVPGKG